MYMSIVISLAVLIPLWLFSLWLSHFLSQYLSLYPSFCLLHPLFRTSYRRSVLSIPVFLCISLLLAVSVRRRNVPVVQ